MTSHSPASWLASSSMQMVTATLSSTKCRYAVVSALMPTAHTRSRELSGVKHWLGGRILTDEMWCESPSTFLTTLSPAKACRSSSCYPANSRQSPLSALSERNGDFATVRRTISTFFNDFDHVFVRIVNLKITNALPILLDSSDIDATCRQHVFHFADL